jgi:hypothetical protein
MLLTPPTSILLTIVLFTFERLLYPPVVNSGNEKFIFFKLLKGFDFYNFFIIEVTYSKFSAKSL